jgi:hypothetical protein
MTASAQFMNDVVLVAFREVRTKLETKKRMVAIEYSGRQASIISTRRSKLELKYTITVEKSEDGFYPVVETAFFDPLAGGEQKTKPEPLRSGEDAYKVAGVTKEYIVNSFFERYRAATASPEST